MKNRIEFKSWFAALCAGILLALSFAPWNAAMLAFVALVPLLSRIIPADPARRCDAPFQLGFAAGFLFWLMTIHWVAHVSAVGTIALSAYLALFFAAWAWFTDRLRAQWPEIKGWTHLLIAGCAASAWTALEWFRGWILGGFPWNGIAASQHNNIAFIQIAEWTGAPGVSFVIVFFNLSLWLTWRRLKAERFSPRSWRYEFSAAIFLVALCLLTGMRHLLRSRQPAAGEALELKLALIQPNIPQEVKFEPMGMKEQKKRLRQLTFFAAASQPDLVLWPETSLVEGPSFSVPNRHWLQQMAREVNIPILFGTLDRQNEWAGDVGDHRRRTREYNAVTLARTDGAFGPTYHKLHLVPFGEFIPFGRWVPWLRWLTPIPGSFDRGEVPVLFEIRGVKMGPLICFEDTFPNMARDLAKKGADVLVNFTNDAWFKTSPAAEMHAANAVFRAIETRRPLIRCTNNGLTLVVMPTGQIQRAERLKPFQEGFLITSVSSFRNPPQTFYVRHGDWFAMACLAAAVIGGAFLRRKTPMA